MATLVGQDPKSLPDQLHGAPSSLLVHIAVPFVAPAYQAVEQVPIFHQPDSSSLLTIKAATILDSGNAAQFPYLQTPALIPSPCVVSPSLSENSVS